MAATCAVEYKWVKVNRKVDGEHCGGSKSGVVQESGEHLKQNYFLLYFSFQSPNQKNLPFSPFCSSSQNCPIFTTINLSHSCLHYTIHVHVHTQICARMHTHPHKHSQCSYSTPKDIENPTHSQPPISSRLRNNTPSYRTGL